MRFSELDGRRASASGAPAARSPRSPSSCAGACPARGSPSRRSTSRRRADAVARARRARRAAWSLPARRRRRSAAATSWCARRASRSTAPSCAALRAPGVPVTTATSLWLAERGGRRRDRRHRARRARARRRRSPATSRAPPARDGALAGNIGVPGARPARRRLRTSLAIVELSSYQIADLARRPRGRASSRTSSPSTPTGTAPSRPTAPTSCASSTLPGVRDGRAAGRQPELARRRARRGAAPVRRAGGLGRGRRRGSPATGGCASRPAVLPLPGEHNALNLCAALDRRWRRRASSSPTCAARCAGFEGLAHRLQTVAESGGLTWVDDSISTTPESALAALASFPGRPLVLLGGGQDRGQDYARARPGAGRGARRS